MLGLLDRCKHQMYLKGANGLDFGWTNLCLDLSLVTIEEFSFGLALGLT